MEGDAVEGQVVCISREEVLQTINEMKTGKAPGHSEVPLELIATCVGVGIQVMAEIYQKVVDGFEMPVEWTLSIVVPILKRKSDIRNCSCYRAVKLLEHGMKVVERVLEKRLNRIVSVDEMQFGFMPDRGTIDAVFIFRKTQEDNCAKGKCCMCFVHPKKAFDRVLTKVFY